MSQVNNLSDAALESKDVARQTMQQKIEDHLHCMLDLKMALNALTPIGRLPPEVLSEIFQLFVTDGGSVHKIMSICQRWREVALQIPKFWSKITILIPKNYYEVYL